jgi:hypothetical protein
MARMHCYNASMLIINSTRALDVGVRVSDYCIEHGAWTWKYKRPAYLEIAVGVIDHFHLVHYTHF